MRALGADRGVRVLLTREDDRQISLMQRAAFANGAGASALHQLARQRQPVTTHHRRRGGVVRPVGHAGSRAAQPRIDRSWCPLTGGGTRRVALVSWDQAQARHADVAAGLAQQIGERLERVAPLGPRSVYQSPLRPLTAVNLPAVLVDLGYLSNREEEKLAAADPRQAALGQALVEAVLAFDPSPRARRTAPR